MAQRLVHVGGKILQDAQTTGNGDAADLSEGWARIVIYVTWSAGVTAGVVSFETASSTTYTGTWSSHATVTFSTADTEDTIQTEGVFRAVRTRITTNVTGGTVTTVLDAG